MGVFYSSPQAYVIQELRNRKSVGYLESRMIKGCYITMTSRRVEPVTENYKDLDTGEAIMDLGGELLRGAVDFTGAGVLFNVLGGSDAGTSLSESVFGEKKESEAMSKKQRVVGQVVRETGKLSTLASTDLNSRYATTTGKPTPAIQKLDVEMSGDYGSLQKCVLQVRTFDKPSFEEFERKFMVPGTEVNMKYGRVGQSGPANNAEFNGVVYDYSFKLNEYLGYDCEVKAVAKGSLSTELNAMAKIDDKDRVFCSDYEWLNEYQRVANIADVFDYDIQEFIGKHKKLHKRGGKSFKFGNYPNAGLAGCDAPNSAPEPENDGMVNGNVAFCTLGYIVNKLINVDLFKGNVEGNKVKSNSLKIICNDNVTIGKRYDKLMSANPMKILWLGDKLAQQTYGGTGGLGLGAQTFGATKIWGKKFKHINKTIESGDFAKLANILISRDCLRGHLGAGGMGAEGSKISVAAFLTKLFEDIYNHSGGAWDLTLTSMTPEQASEYGEQGGDNFMYVIDRNWAPGARAQKLELNSNVKPGQMNNYCRNVQLTGKVPKDMAAAAFVGGAGTASGKKSSTVEVIKGEPVTTLANEAKIRNDIIESREVIHDTGYNSETISAAKSNLKAYVESCHSHLEKASFRKDMYPLELSATLDGIAGIQFGNACSTDLAPSRYTENSPKVVFTVTKTKHSISPNDWITEVESICRMEK